MFEVKSSVDAKTIVSPLHQPKLVRLELALGGAAVPAGFDTLKAELLPFGLRSKFKILPEESAPREEAFVVEEEAALTNGFTRLDCPPVICPPPSGSIEALLAPRPSAPAENQFRLFSPEEFACPTKGALPRGS